MPERPVLALPAGASTVHLPVGDWPTLLEGLCARFPTVSRARWLDRFARGRVLDAEGQPLAATQPYRVGQRVHYFREVEAEAPIPFEETVLHQDAHLLVLDKPHFLPVMPSGAYVEQTLLARLMKRLDNPHLVPIHRIDRLTAGLVLFSVDPATRDAYQALFRQRRIHKTYEALAPALPQLQFPYLHRSRLEPGEPFFRMREGAGGEPNSETRIEVLARHAQHWHYQLEPVTGRKHQLRVHMAGLGAPILGDPFYPVLLERAQRETDDYRRPLQLLARRLVFDDPLNGQRRCFDSRLALHLGD